MSLDLIRALRVVGEELKSTADLELLVPRRTGNAELLAEIWSGLSLAATKAADRLEQEALGRCGKDNRLDPSIPTPRKGRPPHGR